MRGFYFNADNFKRFIRKILSGPKPNCISYIDSNTTTLPISAMSYKEEIINDNKLIINFTIK